MIRWWISLCLVLIATNAAAQERSSKQEWERLTPAQQQKVKQRFELWKRMPDDQKQALIRRHDALVELKSKLDDGAASEPKSARDDQPLRRFLEKRRKEILSGDRFTPDEIESMAPDEIFEAARDRALDRVDRLESEGIVDAEQARRLRELPPPKLGRELRKFEKKRFLARPPREFLELPESERERLAALSPEEFLREIKRVVPPPSLRPPSPKHDGRRDDPRLGRKPMAPPDPRFLATKQWIDEHLTEQERAAIRAAEPFERRGVIRELLRARAEAALRERGGDPKWLEEIDLLPTRDREMRWIQLVDPGFEPPPPPRAPGARNQPRDR